MIPLTVSHPPASAGLLWIKEGWRVFKLAPVPWMGMTALAFMVVIGVSMIPWVGHFAIELLSPFLVAGYFSASRAALAGEPVTFIHLAAGSQNGRDALLRIGVAYMVGSWLVFELVNLLTGSDLREVMRQVRDPAALPPAELERLVAAALPAMMLASALFAPLLMATWFSPRPGPVRRFSGRARALVEPVGLLGKLAPTALLQPDAGDVRHGGPGDSLWPGHVGVPAGDFDLHLCRVPDDLHAC